MPPKKSIAVTVSTLDSTLELSIQPNTIGQQLLNDVLSNVAIEEEWFFGLKYVTQEGYSAWLAPHEKVLNQVDSKKAPLRFKIGVLCYPEDASEDLIQDITKRYIFNEAKESILSGKILCSKEEAQTFAVYYCQAVFGDFRPDAYKPGELASVVLPQRVLKMMDITTADLENSLVPEWIELTQSRKCRLREDAMVGYIEHAEHLEMYGKTYSPIQNKDGRSLQFCTCHSGVQLFEKDYIDKLCEKKDAQNPVEEKDVQKPVEEKAVHKCVKENDVQNPVEEFLWDEIADMVVNGKKLTIRLQSGQKRVYTAVSSQIIKNIRLVCLGNRDQYFRRREPESDSVKQMRARVREDRESKEISGDYADDEEVRSLKQQLQFYEAQARRTQEELTARKLNRGHERRQSVYQRSVRMAKTLKRLSDIIKEEKDIGGNEKNQSESTTQEVDSEATTKAEQGETEVVVIGPQDQQITEEKEILGEQTMNVIQTQEAKVEHMETNAGTQNETTTQQESQADQTEKIEDDKPAEIQGVTEENLNDENGQSVEESLGHDDMSKTTEVLVPQIQTQVEQCQLESSVDLTAKDAEISRLQKEMNSLQLESSAHLTAKDAEISRLRKEMDSLQLESAAHLTAKDAEISRLHKEMNSLQADLQARDDRIQEMEAQNAREINQLTQELRKFQFQEETDSPSAKLDHKSADKRSRKTAAKTKSETGKQRGKSKAWSDITKGSIGERIDDFNAMCGMYRSSAAQLCLSDVHSSRDRAVPVDLYIYTIRNIV